MNDNTIVFDTVIFDLDGTLLNTLDDLMDATNYALSELHYPVRTIDEIRNFVGNGVGKLMERSLPDGIENPHFEDAMHIFRQRYSVHCEDKTRTYDGITELLQQLKAVGCKIAVVSNKPDYAVKQLCKRFFQETVDVAIGEKQGIRRKPAPDMVENALSELGSCKEKAIYVGDSDVDIQTAANSGLKCISVTWGFRSTAFLKEHGASRLADTPQQVFQTVGNCKQLP